MLWGECLKIQLSIENNNLDLKNKQLSHYLSIIHQVIILLVFT